MEVINLPKDLTPERISALISLFRSEIRFGAFRQKMLSSAAQYSQTLAYALGTKVEYPSIGELMDGVTSASHNFRLLGGVTLSAIEEHSPLGKRIFHHLITESTTLYHTLTAALFTEATLVYASGEGTFHVETLLSGKHAELIVVVALPGARLSIVEEFRGEANRVSSRTLIVFAESGAYVDIRTQTQGKIGGSLHLFRYGLVEQDAEINWHEVYQGINTVQGETQCDLLGPHARSRIAAVLFTEGKEVLDLHHRVRHFAGDGRSRITASGGAKGVSHVYYRGDIEIKKGMKRVDARQDARFVVLEKTAKIDAIPALSIFENEVSSGHTLSVGYLSLRELFYPKTRGLTEKEARGFLISGMTKGMLLSAGVPDREAYEMSRVGEASDKQYA